MTSPIYFFTRSGCVWCQKMKPAIDHINETLNDEQKIEILSIDEPKSKLIYDNIIRMNKLQNVVPLMYKMIDTLEKFVDLDVPMNIENRKERIAGLRNVIMPFLSNPKL